MKKMNISNITLMASVASTFMGIGAQLYALLVVAGTVAKAPPRSFAILEGAYRYDSSVFWNTFPPISFALLILALIANWKTTRRNLILFAFALFLVGGLLAGLLVEPMFAEMKAHGYSDKIDPIMQARAAKWYALDWTLWSVSAICGVLILIGLMRPATKRLIKAH